MPIVLGAVLAGLVAWALTPFLRRCATSDAAILRGPWHVVAAAALGALAGLAGTPAELALFVLLAAGSGLLVVVDFAEERLPDAIVLPLLGLTVVLLVAAAATTGQWGHLWRALLVAAALFVLYFAMMVFSPDLGFGDVKLMAVAGLFLGWFGWGAAVLGACLGWVAYAVPAAVRMATRARGERGSLPFGPFLILGAVVGVFWASRLLTW